MSQALAPSSHTDTFTRDRLPPQDQWPEFVFDRPELQYPEQLNCVQALLDDHIDQGQRITQEAAMAKMTATENAQQIIDMAVQMHGGMGVKKGCIVESLYREIRALRIYEGATEVQQLIIGRDLLK